ncbi:hypothetical protein LTR08_003286 [Meristemomyces frigidus]|nr:hypothetical protein LTR08_003286 [Meristemomyces frigidus]
MAAFEDLSGSSAGPSSLTSKNPYEALIEACEDDPAQIQARYSSHRANRNAQQRAKLLAPDFPGVVVDDILAKLDDPTIEPDFTDWRHCLVFWARPPPSVGPLVATIQHRLLQVAPNLWTMPAQNLHMTALEVIHSLTAQEIDAMVEKMLPGVPDITDYTREHRARLVKPLVSYDAQALALSFLPAAGEPGRVTDDSYTYHHLRRDLHNKAQSTGVKVASRYVIPSAHLTIARFVTKRDFETADGDLDHAKVETLIAAIDEINNWLEVEYWPRQDSVHAGGEWIVGEGKGLDFRKGALWYGGGGETVHLGEGF